MGEPITFNGRKENFTWVKDRAGNEYICPVSALKDPKNATKDELASCVDDATASVNPRGG